MNYLEHKTVFQGIDSELSVYQTSVKASNIEHHSSNLICAMMISGRKVVSISGSEKIDLLPNDIILLSPGQHSSIDFPEADTCPTKCITIEISEKKVSGILEKISIPISSIPPSGETLSENKFFTRIQMNDSICRVFRKLSEIFMENTLFKNELIELNICELIIRLLQTRSGQCFSPLKKRNTVNSNIKTALKYIKNNIQQKISIAELASVAGMSKSSFYRYFKTEMNTCPHQYINQKRISRACSLLADKKNSIADISYLVGFKSPSHFVQIFKKDIGITPKRYQKQLP